MSNKQNQINKDIQKVAIAMLLTEKISNLAIAPDKATELIHLVGQLVEDITKVTKVQETKPNPKYKTEYIRTEISEMLMDDMIWESSYEKTLPETANDND